MYELDTCNEYHTSEYLSCDGIDDDFFDCLVRTYLDNVICEDNCITEEDYQRHLKIIDKIYKSNLEYSDTVPDLDDIVISVALEYNSEQFYIIASYDIDYYLNGSKHNGYASFYERDELKNSEDIIFQVAEDWQQDFYVSLYNLESYVSRILIMEGYCFTDSTSQIMPLDGKSTLVVNDAQNVLFENWQIQMIDSFLSPEFFNSLCLPSEEDVKNFLLSAKVFEL